MVFAASPSFVGLGLEDCPCFGRGLVPPCLGRVSNMGHLRACGKYAFQIRDS